MQSTQLLISYRGRAGHPDPRVPVSWGSRRVRGGTWGAVGILVCLGSGCSAGAGDLGPATQGVPDDPSTGAAETSSTSDASTSDSTSSTAEADDTGPSLKFDQGTLPPDDTGCRPELIADTLAFEFVKSVEIGIDTLQAGAYDSIRQRLVVFSVHGEGRLLDANGLILGNIEAPPEALPRLDGGTYDVNADAIVLINQDCRLVDVDPESFTTRTAVELGELHGIAICAGVGIDRASNLYIASYGTDELLVVDRTGQTELRRIDMLELGIPGFDGIAEIAGSENFLVNSTTEKTAAIISATGQLVAGPGPIGALPIAGGGSVGQPDSMLTICDNGHTWVCDAYGTSCSDFAPADGDKAACGCLIAG